MAHFLGHPNPLVFFSLSPSITPRIKLLTMATATYSSAPMPLYDIQRNDLVNPNCQATIGNDGFDMGSKESFYPLSLNEVQAPTSQYTLPIQQPNNCSYFQPPQMGFAPTFPTNGVMYNGGLPPTFQPYNAVAHLQAQPLAHRPQSRAAR
jgi:hypothetical protein